MTAPRLPHHRRTVTWLKPGVPLTTFSQSARYEVGSALTVFRIRNHEREFADYIERGAPASPGTSAASLPIEEAIDAATDEPSAERIETYTRDFIVDTLWRELEGVEFKHFVAHLLEAMGYRARATQASGDGGVDVIAHRDRLGLEPPIIKVQRKQITASIGGPDV